MEQPIYIYIHVALYVYIYKSNKYIDQLAYYHIYFMLSHVCHCIGSNYKLEINEPLTSTQSKPPSFKPF